MILTIVNFINNIRIRKKKIKLVLLSLWFFFLPNTVRNGRISLQRTDMGAAKKRKHNMALLDVLIH
jgi:hypothetical protein